MDDMICQELLSCLLVLQSNWVGFSFVLFSFEFTIVSVSCFLSLLAAVGRQSGTQRTAHTLSLLLGLGQRCNETFFLFSYLTVGLWFVFFHYLGDISDRSWQRKTIDFFRVFFVLYHQNMYLFWNDFCICTFVYVLYCFCRSWLWQWEHFRPAAETLFLCLYTVLASFPFFWISWISPPHLFIFL